MSDAEFDFVDYPMASPPKPTVTSPSSPPVPQASPVTKDSAAPQPSHIATVVGHAVPVPDVSPAWWDENSRGEQRPSPPQPNRQLPPMPPPPPSGVANVPGTTTTAIRLKKIREIRRGKASDSAPNPQPPLDLPSTSSSMNPPPMYPPPLHPPGFTYPSSWSIPGPPPPMPPLGAPLPPAPLLTALTSSKKGKKKGKGKTFPAPLPPPPPPPPLEEYISCIPPPPPEPQTFIRERANVRRPPSISRPRSISRSPSPPRRWMGLEDFESSSALFRTSRWDDSVVEDRDKVIRLSAWGKNVYVTRHAATPIEFKRFLPLIRFGVPDRWYDLSSREMEFFIKTLGNGLNGGSTTTLPAVPNARPQNQETPRIAATAALMTPTNQRIRVVCQGDCEHPDADSDADSGNEESDHDSNASFCGPCSRNKANTLAEDTELKYISIVQSVQQSNNHDVYIHEPVDNSTPMYKVVVTGNREAAAAEAFYNAGANGWSTIFTCCVRADAEDGSQDACLIYRAEKLWNLANGFNYNGLITVFY